MTETIIDANLRKQLKKTLTRKNITNWLKTKSPKAKVGVSLVPNSCPIYRFLKQNGMPVLSVTRNYTRLKKKASKGYRLASPECKIENPDWVRNFIIAVDGTDEKFTTFFTKPVTAKDALDILKKI